MIIYGKNAIKEALNSGKTINKLFVENRRYFDKSEQEILDKAKSKIVKISFEQKNFLTQKCASPNHQGFVADITEFVYCTTKDILEKASKNDEPPFILILDGITDPQNFGAIIRTAECSGVHGIIISKDRSCSVNEIVYKTSAGAVSNMLIAKVTNLNREIENLKRQNVWIYGLEVGGKNIYNTNLKGAIALVTGSEGKGLRQLVQETCDEIVSLPLKGQISSLNASVATGIAVYEILRQRLG